MIVGALRGIADRGRPGRCSPPDHFAGDLVGRSDSPARGAMGAIDFWTATCPLACSAPSVLLDLATVRLARPGRSPRHRLFFLNGEGRSAGFSHRESSLRSFSGRGWWFEELRQRTRVYFSRWNLVNRPDSTLHTLYKYLWDCKQTKVQTNYGPHRDSAGMERQHGPGCTKPEQMHHQERQPQQNGSERSADLSSRRLCRGA